MYIHCCSHLHSIIIVSYNIYLFWSLSSFIFRITSGFCNCVNEQRRHPRIVNNLTDILAMSPENPRTCGSSHQCVTMSGPDLPVATAAAVTRVFYAVRPATRPVAFIVFRHGASGDWDHRRERARQRLWGGNICTWLFFWEACRETHTHNMPQWLYIYIYIQVTYCLSIFI